MSGIAEHVAALKARGDLTALPEAIPYARFMGIGAEVQGERLVARMRYADHLVGNPALPALHGGATGALLESAAIFELIWRAETAVLPKTISVTVEYLRSARPLETFASAWITKHGRQVVNLRAEAWQDDPERLIATAHAHFLVASR